MNEQNWITATINVNLINSELKENMNLNIREVKENVNLKICEVNDGKNRAVAVEKLQLGKNQTQCKWYSQVGVTRKMQRGMQKVKRLVAGTNPRVIFNQSVSGRMARDFDFALSSIYDGDGSSAEYIGTVEASAGFAEYPTEQFPVD